MRYYDIQITNPDGSKFAQYTSLLPSGLTDMGALNVEFDVGIWGTHEPAGNWLIKIWGLDFKSFSNAKDFNGKTLRLFAGMQKGLPLANPKQAGRLIKGEIFQSFGNWIETDMTMVFIVNPDNGTTELSKELVFNWPAGTSLQTAIANMLSASYPGVRQDFNIKSNLITNESKTAKYNTLVQFTSVINPLSKSIIKDPGYQGVVIHYDGFVLRIFDSVNSKQKPIVIKLEDLMGQPMWIDVEVIQVRLVMRGDLNLGDTVTLPATPITTTGAALTQFQDPLTFSGDYMIIYIRHVGNFREPNGASWNTTVNMLRGVKTAPPQTPGVH